MFQNHLFMEQGGAGSGPSTAHQDRQTEPFFIVFTRALRTEHLHLYWEASFCRVSCSPSPLLPQTIRSRLAPRMNAAAIILD
jgi:hypothetical protein